MALIDWFYSVCAVCIGAGLSLTALHGTHVTFGNILLTRIMIGETSVAKVKPLTTNRKQLDVGKCRVAAGSILLLTFGKEFLQIGRTFFKWTLIFLAL